MEFRKLLPLVGILAVLLIIGVVKKNARPRASLAEEADLKALAPAGFLVSDIDKLTFTNKKGDKTTSVEIKRTAKNEWILASLFDTPAASSKITSLLDDIKGLEGELRADKADVLKDFDLTPDAAVELRCYKKGEDKPCVSLLIGKNSGYKNCFVRKDGDNNVYDVNINLRSKLGLHGDDSELSPKEWLKKKFIRYDASKVRKVRLTWPDKEIVIEKKEKLKPKKKTDGKDKDTDKDKDKDKKEDKPRPEEKEYEWVLTKGPENLGFKTNRMNDLIGAFEGLEAVDSKDPAKAEEFGLDKPAFRAVLTMEDGKTVTVDAVRRAPGNTPYVRVKGQPFIYEVETWRFDKCFPKGSNLFTLPVFNVKESELVEIEVQGPKDRFTLKRKADSGSTGWTLVGHDKQKLDTSKASDIGWALGGLSVQDFALGLTPEQTGLAVAKKWVRCGLKNGNPKAFSIGNPSLSTEGYYARIPGSDLVVIFSKSTIDRIMVDVDSLLKKETKKDKEDK